MDYAKRVTGWCIAKSKSHAVESMGLIYHFRVMIQEELHTLLVLNTDNYSCSQGYVHMTQDKFENSIFLYKCFTTHTETQRHQTEHADTTWIHHKLTVLMSMFSKSSVFAIHTPACVFKFIHCRGLFVSVSENAVKKCQSGEQKLHFQIYPI